jgi:hypothetical protein
MKDYGASQMRSILNFLKLILNYIKIPFQMYTFNDPVHSNLELKKISSAHIVMSRDQINAYYSNNCSIDQCTHDTSNMFKNTSIYMHLYDMNVDTKEALFRWIFMNTHGGYALTNGTSRPGGSDDKLMFHSQNVNLETISALNLLMLKKSYANKLMDNYETLFQNLQRNDYCLNYVTNPGGNLSDKFLKELQKVGYNNLKVSLKNSDTDMSLGCSSDAAVTLLATLAIMQKIIGDAEYTRLFNKFNTLYGYGLKAKGCSTSFSAITSLFILYKLTKHETYKKLLMDRFGVGANIDSEFGNYLYSQLIGVK